MAIDEFEEVNEAEERENARERRGARLRAMWRAHPVLFSIGAVLVVYLLALGRLLLRPQHLRGASDFLLAGVVTLFAIGFAVLRLWLRRRAKRARSDWT